MKKVFLNCMLLLCALIVGTNAWATASPYVTADFTAKTEGHSAYTDNWTYGDWSLTNCANNNKSWAYIRCGGKGGNKSSSTKSGTTTIQGTAYINKTISEVKLLHGGISNANVTISSIVLEVSSSSTFSSISNTVTISEPELSVSTADNLSFTTGAPYAINSYYRVKINWSVKGSSNMGLDVTKLEFYTPTTSSSVTFSEKTPSITFPSATTYSQEPSTASGYSSEDGASITYEITANTAGASINSEGVVTVTHEGEVTVKATAAEIAGKYSSSDDSYTLTVVDNRSDAGISFASATEETTLGSGYTGQVLTNTHSLSPISWTSTNTDVATVSEGTVTVKASGETTIKALFAGNSTYKAAEASYTLTVNKKDPNISYSTDEAEAVMGKTFIAPTLSNPNSLILSFESTETDVATINSDGEVTIVGTGKTTIKASYAETSEWLEAEISYELTVVEQGVVSISFNDNDLGISGTCVQDATLSYTLQGITLDFEKVSGQNSPRIDGADYTSGVKVARLYNESTLTISAPTDFYIKEISFDFNKGSLTNGGNTYSSSNTDWTGKENSVEFNCTTSTFINSITITYDSYDLEITPACWASMWLPFDVNIPSGIKAYYAKSTTNNSVTLTSIDGGVIPGKTGVVVTGNAGNYNFVKSTTATEINSLFAGDDKNITVTANTDYVLASGNSTSCTFALYTGTSIAAYKAYLPSSNVPHAAPSIRFEIEDENGATNIEAIDATEEAVKFIQNGKLFIKKSGVVYDMLGTVVRQ